MKTIYRLRPATGLHRMALGPLLMAAGLVAASPALHGQDEWTLQKEGTFVAEAMEAFNKGDNDKAIADYTQVIRLDPTDIGDAWINRGRAYALKGETDKAIADLSSAIELYPNDAEPYNERASLYRLKGDIAKADADYNLALPLNRRDAQKRLALYQAHQPYHTDKEL